MNHFPFIEIAYIWISSVLIIDLHGSKSQILKYLKYSITFFSGMTLMAVLI
ncbi:MAG: hypothetical protein ABIH20_03645 [Candidatus Diapherotrites archaeon]